MDWDKIALAVGVVPVARKHLLSGAGARLDNAAERFLAKHLAELEINDVLAWIAARGPDEEDVLEGAIPTSRLVARFLELWSPEDGLPLYPTADDGFTIWVIGVDQIAPYAWGSIVEVLLPRLPVGTGESLIGSRRMAAASLRRSDACETFNIVADWKLHERAPREIALARSSDEDDLAELLVSVRRDPASCAARLVERASRDRSRNAIYPLWVLEHAGLLERVADPADVLPDGVRLPLEFVRMSDEERAAAPSPNYLIALALRWPGPGGPKARAWVRSLILAALDRACPGYAVEQFLFGTDGFLQKYPWSRSELTSILSDWLSDPAEFDALVRETVDAGQVLPSAWVTIVRDLAHQREGAWARAFRWIRGVDVNAIACGAQVSGSLLHDAPRRVKPGAGGIAGTGVECSVEAMQWMVHECPLPDSIDDEFVAALDEAFSIVDRHASPANPLCRIPWEVARWSRRTELPLTPVRRASLVAMLLERPAIVADEDVDPALDRIGPLAPEELPPFEEVPWSLETGTGAACRVRDRYLRIGGELARERVLAAFENELRQDQLHPEFVANWLVLVEPLLDEERRLEIRRRISLWSLRDLLRRVYKNVPVIPVDAADPGRLILLEFVDLPAVARARLRDPIDSFERLPPSPEFTEILVERVGWLASDGDAALAAVVAPRASRYPEDQEMHRERMLEMIDEEILGLVAKLLSAGLDWSRLAAFVRSRATHGSAERCAAFLELLRRNGATRKQLVEIACDIVDRGPDRPTLSMSARFTAIATIMSSRNAWETVGRDLVDRLLDRHPHALVGICQRSIPDAKAEPIVEAMQLVVAASIADRVRMSLECGDQQTARRGLLAIMELDPPSRAVRLVLPLKKLSGLHAEIEDVLEACIHLLRREDGRRPYVSTIASALARLVSDDDDSTGRAVALMMA